MLDYLVTSKARRRMLQLLWGQDATGSATELAERAGVGFASAWRELRAMQAIELVVSSREGSAEVFRANRAHPLGRALAAIVRGPARTVASRRDHRLRAQLRALGAPLLAEEPATPRGELEATLARAVQLAHRDPAVARTLPVCLYLQRDALRADRLVHHARQLGEKRAMGFFLDLTTELSRDPRFATWTAPLRDARFKAQRDFFHGQASSRSPTERRLADARTPAPARRWGLRMNMDMDAFRSTFERFTDAR